MESNLVLSHRDDAVKYTVHKSVVCHLQNYHLFALRFLFKCFREKQSGAILNEDEGMNFQLQIAVFLKTLSKNSADNYPILVVTPDKNFLSWNYHLKKFCGLDIAVLSEHNAANLFKKNEQFVILVTEKQLKVLQKYEENNFFLVVIDELDSIVNRRIFNRLCGLFNIGLTHRNFFRHGDPKLMWKMMHWANPSKTGTQSSFNSEYEDYVSNLIDPFTESWLRITWQFSSSFKKPTFEEQNAFAEKIKDWAESANIISPDLATITKRKRVAEQRQRQPPKKQKKTTRPTSPWSSEEEEQNPDVSIFNFNTSIDKSSRQGKFCFETSQSQNNVGTKYESDKEYTPPRSMKQVQPKSDSKVICRSSRILGGNLSMKTRRVLFANNNAILDNDVISEFEQDFTPSQFRKSKSESNFGNDNPKIIDRYVLEEFSREFNVDEALDRSKSVQNEILGTVTNLFASKTIEVSDNAVEKTDKQNIWKAIHQPPLDLFIDELTDEKSQMIKEVVTNFFNSTPNSDVAVPSNKPLSEELFTEPIKTPKNTNEEILEVECRQSHVEGEVQRNTQHAEYEINEDNALLLNILKRDDPIENTSPRKIYSREVLSSLFGDEDVAYQASTRCSNNAATQDVTENDNDDFFSKLFNSPDEDSLLLPSQVKNTQISREFSDKKREILSNLFGEDHFP